MEKKTIRKAVGVGDVVMSPLFAVGYTDHGDGYIWVGEGYGTISVERSDPSRANAKFVVEEKFFVHATAGTAECWLIIARRLNLDGIHNPDGEAIAFHMEADYNSPFIDEIEVVGKMRRVLTFESIE